MSSQGRKSNIGEVVRVLRELYPAAQCSLEYTGQAWKLLVMGRLSAQCTDARVNIVCATLFERFPTARALADGDISEIEEIVRPCGLYKVKAANIKEECRMLCEEYDGILPDNMEELLRFPGVGRKIANLLLGDIFHKPAIVADTHCIRISGRLGLTDGSKDPVKVEKQLAAVVPTEESSDLCHRFVLFGREYCTARAPRCGDCPLAGACEFGIRNSEFRIMKKTINSDHILLTGIDHFDIYDTFDCGQCFRFEKTADGAVEGVAYGKYLRVEQPERGTLRIYSTDRDYTEVWEHFMALDCDYTAVQESVRSAFGNDPTMAAAIGECDGIRILRQEPWEALCSFIISQNNNIPRIKGIIRNLCETYGNPIDTPFGVRYTFPDAQTVADAGIDGIAKLRTGFRAKYINAAAVAVSSGELSLEALAEKPTSEVLSELCRLYGVGLKVASCVALFGLGKTDAFPVDVWVRRILEKYYPAGLDVTALGEYAGVAQQYLFHYERKTSGVITNA